MKSIQHEAGEEAGEKIWLLAGARGKIVLRRSCVQIESVMPDGLVLNSTIIFPENYFIEEDTRGWAVKNASGEVWAIIGESKEISGGALEKPAMWQGAISTEDQRRCPGPYWLLAPPEALNQPGAGEAAGLGFDHGAEVAAAPGALLLLTKGNGGN